MRFQSPYWILPLLYLGAALLVDPRGEFPLNDDWSYTRSAFTLAREHRIRIDEWSAMSLIGQTLYGGLLVKTFAESFLLLRVSTMAFAVATAWVLWALFTRLGMSPRHAWILVLGWSFNPIYFNLSFTFMTEIPFLFFIALGMLLLFRHTQSGSLASLVAAGASLGYAFLIRQTALLFLAPALIAILLFPSEERKFHRRLVRAIALISVPSLLIGAYVIWLRLAGGPTTATWRKIDLLLDVSIEQIVGNSLGSLFYLSLLLLPAIVTLNPWIVRWREESPITVRIPAIGWSALALTGIAWFGWRYSDIPYLPSSAYHCRMPYLLNILYDSGLGPLTLDPTYYGTPPTPTYPRLWVAITLVAATGLVGLGLLIHRRCAERGSLDPGMRQFRLAVLGAAIFVLVFEIAASHIQEGGLFDRHILSVALPLLAFLAGRPPVPNRLQYYPAKEETRMERVSRPAALMILSVWIAFSVSATHDYFSWNRIRWELGRELLARGTNPLHVSGGFEFNAWNNYDTFRARGGVGRIYHWWYDRPDYVIAMNPAEGMQILDTRVYFSWVHSRSVAIYLLKQI